MAPQNNLFQKGLRLPQKIRMTLMPILIAPVEKTKVLPMKRQPSRQIPPKMIKMVLGDAS